MSRAGIVIVTYNSARVIGACLDAALETGAEIIVVDNGSCEETVQEASRRGVRVIANRENRGFAGAVNQGIRALESPFILLLNPDAVLRTGIDDLVRACGLPNSAGAGGKLVGEDGRAQKGFFARSLPTPAALIFESLLINRLWPNNPVNRRYRLLDFDDAMSQELEQPAGALLMVRRDVWERLGGFDERYYPLWFEDVDFCKRARDVGYRFYYSPMTVAQHAGAHSLGGIRLLQKQLYWYGSLLTYSAAHFAAGRHRLVCAAVVAGAAIRMMAGCAASRSFAPFEVYGKVAGLAGVHMLRRAGRRRSTCAK
jgi:GT2 family glycosyltransferase